MNCRKSILSAAIVAGLGFAAQAYAQEAETTQANETQTATELDTITVIGIRGSVEKSLDLKRDADSHVEVVTAEDIGKLSAKNVADTLRQLPGVNIGSSSADEGGFDEADRVSLRGTNPSLTQTLINGHSIASGDWFVMSQYQTIGRSVSYSLFPSEIVSQVVVNKTSEAKLVEGGTAGSVNIITRKPLDFADKLTIAGSVGSVYSDLADDSKPQMDALLNWRNDAGTLGIMVQGFSEQRSLRRDGQEIFNWQQISADSATAASNPDLAGVYYPGLVGSTLFEQKRERKGGSLSIQVKPTDNLSLSLNGFYSKLKASNFNRNYMLWGSNFIESQAPDSYTVENGVLTSATWSGTNTYGVYDQISRPGSSADSQYLTLDADWAATDSLNVRFQAGTTKGHGKTDSETGFETNTSADGASYNLNGASTPISWSLDNATTSGFGWAWGNTDVEVVDKEDWFSADASWFSDGGILSSIDFGIRYSEHTRDIPRWTSAGPGCSDGTTPAESGLDWSQPFPYCAEGYSSLYDPSLWPSSVGSYPDDYGDGLGGEFPTDIWYFNSGDLDALGDLYLYDDAVVRNYFNYVRKVREKTGAAYVQANLAGERWSGNVGLRYVKTDGTINYNQALGSLTEYPEGAVTTSAFGAYLPVVAENNYKRLLPSGNLKFEVTDDLVARFAASQTLTRPDYSALAGTLTLTDLTHTGEGGNPDLKPIYSTNLDASLEWYFAPRALLSFSVFSMDLRNYVDYATQDEELKDMTASESSGTDVYAIYAVTRPRNTDAKVKGLELGYEQPIGEYFGIMANYTYVDGETEDGGPVSGTSENTYNLSGYFENKRFNARINYSYRSSYYAGVTRGDNFYQDDFATVSASLGYKVNDNLSITLDGLNLNDPTLKYYNDIAGVGHLPLRFYKNGRQYYLNLRFKF